MAGDEYAGFMVYESEKDVIAYIRAMYFRPEFRNKNLGFGFQKVIAKRGVKKIIALSYEHNIEFKQTKRKRLICTKDGLNFWDINLDRGN